MCSQHSVINVLTNSIHTCLINTLTRYIILQESQQIINLFHISVIFYQFYLTKKKKINS